MGQKLVKKLSKICQNFCSKFKTSGEDDDDDDDDEEDDWWLLNQVATSSHLVKMQKSYSFVTKDRKCCRRLTSP
jgi:hypothetical protein